MVSFEQIPLVLPVVCLIFTVALCCEWFKRKQMKMNKNEKEKHLPTIITKSCFASFSISARVLLLFFLIQPFPE
jgi:hypothetical protein